MVQRHVREGEVHILRQRGLVQRLEGIQSPLTEEAQALLATFKSSQEKHKTHLAEIEEGKQSGRRGADGNLLPLRP